MPEDVQVTTAEGDKPQTPETVDAPAPETGKDDEQKSESRTYAQDEVDRILAKVRKNERYRARKEVEAYYKGLQEGQQKAAPQPVNSAPEDKAPKRDDFDTYEEFIRADAAYHAKRAVREEREKLEKEREVRTARESEDSLMAKFRNRTLAKYPDIDERLAEIGDMPITAQAASAIAESDFGPDILNYLADNPKECERITKLTGTAAIREIGKLEARFESGAKAEPKQERKPSAAPQPIEPVGGKASPVSADPNDRDDIDTWFEKRNAQIMARKKALRR